MSTDNAQSLLELLWRKQVTSRVEASRLLGVSRPTVSALVEHLLNQGLIRECGKGSSTGGKPPIILEISPDAFSGIGIDIGYESVIRGVRIDATGTIAKKSELPVGKSFMDIVSAVIQLAEDLDCTHVSGIGLAVSGMVNPSTGHIVRSANFDLTDRPLLQELQSRLAQPVFLDNRARMSACAERFAGVARNRSDFGLISLGKSIGSAFCLGNQLYGGSTGMGGEIRNFPVPAYSGTGTITLENALLQDTLNSQHVSAQAAADRCAACLHILLDIFAFDLLVLSGRFEELSPAFHEQLSKRLSDTSCQLVPAHFGRFSAAYGSAVHALEHTIFTSRQRS